MLVQMLPGEGEAGRASAGHQAGSRASEAVVERGGVRCSVVWRRAWLVVFCFGQHTRARARAQLGCTIRMACSSISPAPDSDAEAACSLPVAQLDEPNAARRRALDNYVVGRWAASTASTANKPVRPCAGSLPVA